MHFHLKIATSTVMYHMSGPAGEEKIKMVTSYNEEIEHKKICVNLTMKTHRTTGKQYVSIFRKYLGEPNNVRVMTLKEPQGSQVVGDLQALYFQDPDLGKKTYTVMYKTDLHGKDSRIPRVALVQGDMYDDYTTQRPFFSTKYYEVVPLSCRRGPQNEIRALKQIIHRLQEDGTTCVFRRFFLYPDIIEPQFDAIINCAINSAASSKNDGLLSADSAHKEAMRRFLEHECKEIKNTKNTPSLPFEIFRTQSFSITPPPCQLLLHPRKFMDNGECIELKATCKSSCNAGMKEDGGTDWIDEVLLDAKNDADMAQLVQCSYYTGMRLSEVFDAKFKTADTTPDI